MPCEQESGGQVRSGVACGRQGGRRTASSSVLTAARRAETCFLTSATDAIGAGAGWSRSGCPWQSGDGQGGWREGEGWSVGRMIGVRGQRRRRKGPDSVWHPRRPPRPLLPSFFLSSSASSLSSPQTGRRGRAGQRRTNPSGTTFAARYPQAVEGPSGYPSPPSPATDLARSTYGAPMPAYFSASGADGPGPGSMSVARPAAIPAEVLLQELPDVTAGSLIPLAEVVDASVNEIYKRLVELQDVLPSRHEKARAREVFQFALWARRECVRLLAVVRWCREGPAVAKALVRPALASTPLTPSGSRRRDASAWLRN
jgi:hypothetical protein